MQVSAHTTEEDAKQAVEVEKNVDDADKDVVRHLFERGAHLGYKRTRRHPSTKGFIFGKKNQLDVFDLRKVEEALAVAERFAERLGRERKVLLWVGTKPEARQAVKDAAENLGLPYVVTRWIGGLFTNWSEIKKRLERLGEIEEQKKSGELGKYTKKEQLGIMKERNDLEKNFGGVAHMNKLPDAIFVVDSLHENIAVTEARRVGMPIMSLSNSDCDITKIDTPIVANDAARRSIDFFVERIRDAYQKGVEEAGQTEA